MSNLSNVLEQLKKERNQLQKRVEQLDEALKAQTGSGGVRRPGFAQPASKRKTMSAAARKRIAAGDRAG